MLTMSEYDKPTKIFLLIFLSIGVQTANINEKPKSNLCMFNFEDCVFTHNWTEDSDTKWQGKSKAKIGIVVLSMHRPNARFDTLLKPHPSNGECYCGVTREKKFDLSTYESISFWGKALGNATTYKVILGHDDLKYPNATFEQSFKVIIKKQNYINLPFSKFIPHVNGATLNTKNITSFGFRVCGVNGNETQSGKSSLVVDKVWALPAVHKKPELFKTIESYIK